MVGSTMQNKLSAIHCWSRRVVMLAFWGVVAYISIAVFGSMLLDLYG